MDGDHEAACPTGPRGQAYGRRRGRGGRRREVQAQGGRLGRRCDRRWDRQTAAGEAPGNMFSAPSAVAARAATPVTGAGAWSLPRDLSSRPLTLTPVRSPIKDGSSGSTAWRGRRRVSRVASGVCVSPYHSRGRQSCETGTFSSREACPGDAPMRRNDFAPPSEFWKGVPVLTSWRRRFPAESSAAWTLRFRPRASSGPCVACG